MRINFKKAMGILVAFVSLGSVKAQTDSTDLNFYSGAFVPLTLEDSLVYGTSGTEALYLEFDLDDTTLAKIQLEVLVTDYESNVSSIITVSYTLAELNSLNLISGVHVTLNLGASREGYPQQLYIVLMDALGHEKRTITKYLAE